MKNLLIWGRGGHSAIVQEAAELLGYTTIDTTDEKDHRSHNLFNWSPNEWEVHVAIGNNHSRCNMVRILLWNDYELSTIIHPKAFVSKTAKIGEGCYIGPMATVLARATLGKAVIINTTASVDHDCSIADYAHIAPGAHLCGNVTVGTRSLIAVGGVVVPKITIGDDCILGASSALTRTIEGNNLRLWGIPAGRID